MDHSKLKGLDAANEFARSGKFIFAIKLLERLNPEISRADAKAAVDSFGYSSNKPVKTKRKDE